MPLSEATNAHFGYFKPLRFEIFTNFPIRLLCWYACWPWLISRGDPVAFRYASAMIMERLAWDGPFCSPPDAKRSYHYGQGSSFCRIPFAKAADAHFGYFKTLRFEVFTNFPVRFALPCKLDHDIGKTVSHNL